MNAMSLGPYAPFIVTSYGLAAAVVAILIGWIAIDYRRQKRRLRELDAAGVVRRPARSATESNERSSMTTPPTARRLHAVFRPFLADGAAADRVRQPSPRCSGSGSATAIRRRFPPP